MKILLHASIGLEQSVNNLTNFRAYSLQYPLLEYM
jgi:hypothetical protein